MIPDRQVFRRRQQALDFPPIDRTRGERLIEILRSIALKHDSTPADIAAAATFLANSATSFMTGSVVTVDAGFNA